MDADKPVILDPDFKEHERLFHYTSSAGLYGILESGCLWVTHCRFLNDSRELFRAYEILVDQVRRAVHARIAALKVNKEIHFKEDIDLREVTAQEAKVIVDSMYGSTLGNADEQISGLGHPYVFSTFCCSPEHAEDFGNGALVHWGTYARGGGYAIQLNPHKIKSLLDLERERFAGLVSLSKKDSYPNGNVIPSDLKKAFAKIVEIGQQLAEVNVRGKDIRDVKVEEMLEPFVTAICCTKDAFFAPEREVRSHDQFSDTKNHPVQIRLASGFAAPYVKLFEDTLLGQSCPIERVLVGPHPDNERRVIALKTYLLSKKLDHVGVEVSKVPYVTQLG